MRCVLVASLGLALAVAAPLARAAVVVPPGTYELRVTELDISLGTLGTFHPARVRTSGRALPAYVPDTVDRRRLPARHVARDRHIQAAA
jgi:hypothetical protein